MKNLTFLVAVTVFFVQVLSSQVLPPIQNFQPREYQAENQNWDITQSANGWMYFATNGGLLEFNGVIWNPLSSV